LWDPKRALKQEQREFMIDKYEQKRYYLEPASPLKSLTANNKLSQEAQHLYDCTISKQPVTCRTRNVNKPSVPSIYSSASNFPTQFIPDNNAMTKIQAPTIKNNNGQMNGINRTNILPRNLNNNITSASDSDFVADFSTANIFNGATYNNNLSSKSTKSDNSYSTTQNGIVSNENANFADFEHNPIFSAAFPTSWAFPNNSNNNGKMSSNASYITAPYMQLDRYAALKDLDEQLREDKSVFQSQVTSSVQENQNQNPFKLQNGNLQPISNPFQVLGETKGTHNGAIDNERYAGSNNYSQLHQRNPFQIPNAKSNNPFL
jgi:Arf-GAP domain and FG repeat-containing protein 1